MAIGNPCPAISDHLDDMVGQHDGKIYDSKSEYYKSLKENGLVVVVSPIILTKRNMQVTLM